MATVYSLVCFGGLSGKSVPIIEQIQALSKEELVELITGNWYVAHYLAQRIGGAWYYVRKLDEMPKAWRNDTIRKMYDAGEHTAKDLSRIWRLSHRQVQNILAETGKGTVSRALEEKQMKLF